MFYRKNRSACAVIAACALISTFAALAQASTTTAVTADSTSSNGTVTAARLSDIFSASVGSKTDATALIEGMRAGKDVNLADVTVSGTGKTMGYGNINIALSLAKADAGATATPKGFLSSLNNVMGMRASGLGWGEIAKDLGFKLGEVVRASKSATSSSKADRSEKPGKSTGMADAGKANGKGPDASAMGGEKGPGSNGNGNGNGNAGGAGGGGGNSGGGHK